MSAIYIDSDAWRGSYRDAVTWGVPQPIVPVPVVTESPSGGYLKRTPAYRRRTEEQLRADRERFGILEAAAEVIDQVAYRQAENPGLDSLQQADEIRGELAAIGVQVESGHIALMHQIRADYEAAAAEEQDIVFVIAMLSELDDLH